MEEKFIYLFLAILYGFGFLTALSVVAWLYQELIWVWIMLAIAFVSIMVALLSKVGIRKYARDYWNWVLSDE